ncbi:MAG: Methylcrotonyl-CoA carboxylase biotin-containing subunit protein [bacterium]|nr:Methylcrotonyl-CoA carboxylase biotin-containing subunit protein [bacterium]
MKLQIDIVGGARVGERLTLDAGGKPIRIGRHPDNDVAFDAERDRDASGRHAELRIDGGQLWLYDLGSANGTRLQGLRVAGKAPVPPGAEIEFGAGGPRVRVGYEGAGPLIPATIANPNAKLPPGTVAGGKVGQRTVALMIEQALSRARREPERLRVLVVALAALLVVTVGGVVVAYRLRPPADVTLRREMVKIMEQQRAASDADRATLQKKLDELSGKLQHAGGRSGGGADIAKGNRAAIWLVAVHAPSGQEEGFCSAFAVADDRLVTNAHCVAAAEDLRRRGGQIVVVQNGDARLRLPVERMRRVRGFVPGGAIISPDVGWLKVDGKLPSKVTLAAAQEFQALGTGDPMFTYGFPGRLADVSAPEATFVEGVVGRITTIDGRAGDVKELRLIQHSAFTSGGTSGSPIFNAAGHVVAVNTGGYVDKSRALAGYNFGMRIDLAQELLSEADE